MLRNILTITSFFVTFFFLCIANTQVPQPPCLTCNELNIQINDLNQKLKRLENVINLNQKKATEAQAKNKISVLVKANSNIFVATTLVETAKVKISTLTSDNKNCVTCKK